LLQNLRAHEWCDADDFGEGSTIAGSRYPQPHEAAAVRLPKLI
jgi:hypothetical protein